MGVMKMAEKVYYFLNGLVLSILIAINIKSRGEYISVMVLYAFLWTCIELVTGMIKDIIEIRQRRERRGRKR